jgi:MFS family permease
MDRNRRSRLIDALGLQRDIVVMASMIFLLSTGEELWARYLPKYLELLGASITIIGFFGSARDLLDAAYLYPSGYVSDRIGSQQSLIAFCALSFVGYAFYLVAPHWSFIFIGLTFVMVSPRTTPPAMFAVIAEELPYDRHVTGFSVVSVFKRIPEMLAPLVGGLLITGLGLRYGMKVALLITLVLTAITILVQRRFYVGRGQVKATSTNRILEEIKAAPPPLRRLLVSDILVKTADRMITVLVVLYLIDILDRSVLEVGTLVAIQKIATVIGYVPAASLADRYGRKPFVVISFLSYTLFPLALVLSYNFATLSLAFLIDGFRQVGEPARKAVLVDLARAGARGRTIGLYHFIRSLAIMPAAAIGGLLWNVRPVIPFLVASFIGFMGAILFIISPDVVRAEAATLGEELAI